MAENSGHFRYSFSDPFRCESVLYISTNESISPFVGNTSLNPKYWSIKHGRSKPSHQNTTKDIEELREKGIENVTAKDNERLFADVRFLPDVMRMFHLFSKLPAELTIKMWTFALPGPQVMALVSLDVTKYS
jgi:hypothetical protein